MVRERNEENKDGPGQSSFQGGEDAVDSLGKLLQHLNLNDLQKMHALVLKQPQKYKRYKTTDHDRMTFFWTPPVHLNVWVQLCNQKRHTVCVCVCASNTLTWREISLAFCNIKVVLLFVCLFVSHSVSQSPPVLSYTLHFLSQPRSSGLLLISHLFLVLICLSCILLSLSLSICSLGSRSLCRSSHCLFLCLVRSCSS